jgi:hypothetical protein
METKISVITIGKRLLFIAIIFAILFMPPIFPHSKKVGLFLQAIGAGASTIIPVFAIWGEQVKARFFGPKLILFLYKPEGEEKAIRSA